jgi:hypothetical protein
MLEVGPSSGETLMRRRHSSGVGYANGCLLEIGARAASVGSWVRNLPSVSRGQRGWPLLNPELPITNVSYQAVQCGVARVSGLSHRSAGTLCQSAFGEGEDHPRGRCLFGPIAPLAERVVASAFMVYRLRSE